MKLSTKLIIGAAAIAGYALYKVAIANGEETVEGEIVEPLALPGAEADVADGGVDTAAAE